MEEASRLRLVRCPKCQNLLQEIPNEPVYKCGGCGAFLQAEKQSLCSSNESMEKSNEESSVVSSEKFEGLSNEKRVNFNLSGISEVLDRERNGLEPRKREKENSFSSNRESVLASPYFPRKTRQETRYSDKYRHFSKDPVENRVMGNNHEMNIDRDNGVGVKHESRESEHQIGYRRSKQVLDYGSNERDQMTANRRTTRAVVDNVSFPGSSYPNYQQPGSSYGNGGMMNNHNNLSGSDRVELLEEDRAELLRKLEEITQQLTRSCSVSKRAKETVPLATYVGESNWVPTSSSRSKQVPSQPFPMAEHLGNSPYISNVHGPVSMMHGPERDMQGFYNAPVAGPGHGDVSGPNMPGRAPYPPWQEYPQQSSHGYFSGQVLDVNREQVPMYQHTNSFHHPECACPHCYNRRWQVPSQGPPINFRNRGFLDPAANNPATHRLEDANAVDPWACNRIHAKPPLISREGQAQTRANNEDAGLDRGRFQRVSLAKRSGRRCLPIAGGAPFIACDTCFELLPLPRLLLMGKRQQKLRCGGCSTINSVSIGKNRLVISAPPKTKKAPLEVSDGSLDMVKDGILRSHGYPHQSRTNHHSNDYENSDFVPMDERVSSSQSEKSQDHISSSSSSFEDEESLESVISRQDISSSYEFPTKANVLPHDPGSPTHERYGLPSDQIVSKLGNGNMSKRRDGEIIAFTSDTSRQSSVHSETVVSEMDVSFKEYLNSDVPRDSKVITEVENKPKNGKAGDSFFVGLMKKSFKDLSKSNQTEDNEEPNVFVNGQPIPERLVKKAEKLAGAIQPGEYWYDPRAGFWGMMGQPCLGIIPPFIEEFSYPLPKNCSNGDTRVFVNGRELHEKDLDLLASRGLPTTSDKSYIVEISGRILDEDSGEELDCLGKLAPTVERLKRGFGMCIPGGSA